MPPTHPPTPWPRRLWLTLTATLALLAPGCGDGRTPEYDAIVPTGARVEKLADGFELSEGPVWIDRDGGFLVFSDMLGDTMHAWSRERGLTVFRAPSRETNGNTLDRAGRLLSCEHHARRISRTTGDGTIETVVETLGGRRLNSPNDVVVKRDGSIWFTDPEYGLYDRKKELAGDFVFRFDPSTDALTAVAKDFHRPNGLCFSPDERRLYVADSGRPRHVRVFDVVDDRLAGGDVFYTPGAGLPDGLRCDTAGRLYVSAGDGVHIVRPDGRRVGVLPVPEPVANLCFGGPDGATLFVTAGGSLYAIDLLVGGADARSPR